MKPIVALLVSLATVLCHTACTPRKQDTSSQKINVAVFEALKSIGLSRDYLALPKIGRPYSLPGRLASVDIAMSEPLSMIPLSRDVLSASMETKPSFRFSKLLPLYGLSIENSSENIFAPKSATEVWSELVKASITSPIHHNNVPPPEWNSDDPLFRALRILLYEEAIAQQAYRKAAGNPAMNDLLAVQKHLRGLIRNKEPMPEENRWLLPAAYHQIGSRISLTALGSALTRLQAAVEVVIPLLKQAAHTGRLDPAAEWDTPLGRIRITGTKNDRHSGNFLLLIDLGGDDMYENVGRMYGPGESMSNNISVSIDVSGSDVVTWDKVPGLGAGVFGINIWADLEGNDRYEGNNLGMGVGLFGAGLLWDKAGNDSYQGGTLVEGAAEYGIGVLFDDKGEDKYQAAIGGQGFGGPGGIGILVDLEGNDSYSCGDIVPDQSLDRKTRHQGKHYISMCQGFAFGIRPQASGGIGLLLELDGDDSYKADIFAQGSAYWFGLGMLVDHRGNDRYDCFEHCQGEGVHLGAGLLADWEGDDEYRGYEHAQGVGIDRAVGILYENDGNDTYRSKRDSQGTGLKPYGAGLLIDVAGNDRYEAAATSQGYTPEPNDPRQGFPRDQWPVGILLDLQGTDVFDQPGVNSPHLSGRIQNQQGVAVKK